MGQLQINSKIGKTEKETKWNNWSTLNKKKMIEGNIIIII